REAYFSGGWPHQLRGDSQQSRFPRSVASGQHHAFARRDVEGNSSKCVLAAVFFVDIVETKPYWGKRARRHLAASQTDALRSKLPVSASHEVAQHFFRACSLPSIFRFGDRACLPAQLQAKDLVLESLQIQSQGGVNFRQRGRYREVSSCGAGFDFL